MRGDKQGFAVGAPHQACCAHAVGQARVVDHVGHLHKTSASVAYKPGARTRKLNFATGHGPCAQLVLQAHDAVGVVAAVGQDARQQKKRYAFHTRRRSLDACQHHGKGGIRVRTEPLVAMQLIGISVGYSTCRRGRHIRARALFCHEHGTLAQLIKDLCRQAWKIARKQLGRGKFAQGARQRIGHRQRAAHAKFRLHKEIGQCVFGGGWKAGVPAQHTGAV